MGDVYCKVCGEPWDIAGVLPALHGREDEADMTKKEAEILVSGKGCPSCKGKPTMKCKKCGEVYKGWMIPDIAERIGVEVEEIEQLIYKDKKCIECLGELKKVKYSGYYESLIDVDGEIDVIDYL